MILVKYKDNYADEFDVEGYAVYENEEEFEKKFVDFVIDNGHYYGDDDYDDDDYEFIDDSDGYDDELSIDSLQDALGSDIELSVCVGSNECIDYDSVQDFYDSFTIRDISNEEADVFSKLFDGNVVGMFPF